jgi:hypothetical protein
MRHVIYRSLRHAIYRSLREPGPPWPAMQATPTFDGEL